jgi:hypothetical protein
LIGWLFCKQFESKDKIVGAVLIDPEIIGLSAVADIYRENTEDVVKSCVKKVVYVSVN